MDATVRRGAVTWSGEALWTLAGRVRIGCVFLWTALWISLALLVAVLSASRRPSLWMARRIWAPGVLALLGARLSVSGEEHLAGLPGALLVSNHASHVDIPVLFFAVPRALHFVAKRELARVPFLGLYIRAMGMVFIDRSDHRAAMESLGSAAGLLRAGKLVVSFPEGTRGEDGLVRPFKRGGFAVAVEAGVPVVPVAIRGTGSLLPARSSRLRPGPVQIVFGEPIPTRQGGSEERREIAAAAEEAVHRLLSGLAEGRSGVAG